MIRDPGSDEPLDGLASLPAFLAAQAREMKYRAYQAQGLLGVVTPWYTWVSLKARFPALSRADCQHIELHSPERVAALADAITCIATMWEDPELVRHLPGGVSEGRDPDEIEADVVAAESVDTVVRRLAEVWDDRPGWLQDWRLP